MTIRKSRKSGHPFNGRKSRRRLLAPVMLAVIFLALVDAGGWLLSNQSGMQFTGTSIAASTQPGQTLLSQPAALDVLPLLVGRWRRPDGGYLLEILSTTPDGTVNASYYNPRPIHVSQARVTVEEEALQIFIELNDKGYPGATYTLRFHPEQDLLVGLYYQPAVSQTFKVVFVREDS